MYILYTIYVVFEDKKKCANYVAILYFYLVFGFPYFVCNTIFTFVFATLFDSWLGEKE